MLQRHPNRRFRQRGYRRCADEKSNKSGSLEQHAYALTMTGRGFQGPRFVSPEPCRKSKAWPTRVGASSCRPELGYLICLILPASQDSQKQWYRQAVRRDIPASRMNGPSPRPCPAQRGIVSNGAREKSNARSRVELGRRGCQRSRGSTCRR